MYKPPKFVRQKTFREIAPPNISPPGGSYLEIALKYKLKRSKKGKLPSNYKLAQSILKRKLPSVHISPSKRAFEKYRGRGVFSEFYGICLDWGLMKSNEQPLRPLLESFLRVPAEIWNSFTFE